MSQVPDFQVPAHPSGLDMRLQLNAIIVSLLTNNSGPSEPVQTWPGMFWGDTTANRLRRRDNANTAWIDIGPLDDFLADIRTTLNNVVTDSGNKVSRTGDTMTGSLQLDPIPTNTAVSNLLWWRSASMGAAFRYAQASWNGSLESVNAAGNAVNFGIAEDGTVRARVRFAASYRLELGDAMYGMPANTGEVQLRASDGWATRIRGRLGGGMEWVNNAYNAVPMWVDDGGNLTVQGQIQTNNRLVIGGQSIYQSDGNIWMPGRGQWLFSVLDSIGGKANAGAQCPWGTNMVQYSGGGEFTLPNPWVQVGLGGPGNATLNAIGVNAVWLRNQ